MKYLLDTDHISFLQRRSSSEFSRLIFRMGQHPITDFSLSIISFHEQVIGAHSFINCAQNNIDIARGYALLLETLNGFAKAPVLPFDANEIAIIAMVVGFAKSYSQGCDRLYENCSVISVSPRHLTWEG